MKSKNNSNKKMKISKGYRKFIRCEKSRIRKEVIDPKEQEKLIEELYSQLSAK